MPAIVSLSALSISSVSAEEFNWPKPPTGYDKAAANIPKGTLSAVIQYPTRSNNTRPVRIYTPPGFSKDRPEKYPVLYLHHGVGGNQDAWTSQSGSTNEGYADKIMDYLYAQDSLKVTPMIVVMPFGSIDGNWDKYEDVLFKDLMPYVEANYNAAPEARMRAMAGLSWGAGQTLTYAYRHLDAINWIGAFSPAPNAGTPAGNIKDIAKVKSDVYLNYVAAGTNEENPYLTNSRAYHKFLTDNGVTKVILQVETGLQHERENWDRQLYHFAPRLFKFSTVGISDKGSAQNRATTWAGKGLGFSASASQILFKGYSSNKAVIYSMDGKKLVDFTTAMPSGKR
ncbi:MAG: alpha/beta hydrolase-fold protein [Fibrobacteria bacterium]